MQNLQSFPRHPSFSDKLKDTWKRFRKTNRGRQMSLGETERYAVEVLHSPFRNYSTGPYESDPNQPPLSTASLKTPHKLSRETTRPITILSNRAMDGAGEKRFGNSRSQSVAAIFVHAGAGYHSTNNEHIHLGACNDAARMAMRILRNGESAVAAVEAAIRVFEDKEITNAGYGSNLTIEGVVECDATIVDHLGRSGACGATAKIKNPIHLARVILETSSRPLSLRRVPPNLLVGEGATSFAWEHNVNVVPYDALVSSSARERFLRWRDDLKRAARNRLTPESPSNVSSSCEEETLDLDYEDRVRNQQKRDHTNAMLSGTWNEGQPDSPVPQSPSNAPIRSSTESLPYFGRSPKTSDTTAWTPPSPGKVLSSGISPLWPAQSHSQSSRDGSSPAKRPKFDPGRSSGGHAHAHSLLGPNAESARSTPDIDVSFGDKTTIYNRHHAEGTDGTKSPTEGDFPILDVPVQHSRETTLRAIWKDLDQDLITDTVGAIAIDMFGNIAAGSSSGGIGMKHSGRVGPAALVGIGTAVIPVDPDDPEGITVAAVTSGTGEHMATTMASQKCAERLYFGTQRAPGGLSVEATEEESMQSFVQNDFMDHPGVKNGHSGGAIGVMAVKKTPYGFYLHFAHNTDSFALASMHSNEKEAKCVMSRIKGHASVVQGGRKIRIS